MTALLARLNELLRRRGLPAVRVVDRYVRGERIVIELELVEEPAAEGLPVWLRRG